MSCPGGGDAGDAPEEAQAGGGVSSSSRGLLQPCAGGERRASAPPTLDEGDEAPLENLSPRSRTYTEGLNSGQKSTRVVSLCQTLQYGVHSIQGLRPEMEDAHRVVLDVHRPATPSGDDGQANSPASPALLGVGKALGHMSFFGVFDGHGGSQAAEFSSERMYSLLAQDFNRLVADPVEALRDAIVRTEEQWTEAALRDELFDGTTAAVVVLDRRKGLCVVGNVGDSEVILGTRNRDGEASLEVLTEVHRVKGNAAEAARVEEIGGRVWRGRLAHPKINPKIASLAVSRAIGDIFFKHKDFTCGRVSGLTAEPYVTSCQVRGADVSEQFLILGCDGFWDTVTYEQALAKVLELLDGGEDAQGISEVLVRRAHEAGSTDNITVIVVVL